MNAAAERGSSELLLQPELGPGVSTHSSFEEKTWKARKQLPRKSSDEDWIEGIPMNQIPLCDRSHHVLTFLCQATRSSHRGTPCPLLRTHAAQVHCDCPCRLSLSLKAAPQMQRRERLVLHGSPFPCTHPTKRLRTGFSAQGAGWPLPNLCRHSWHRQPPHNISPPLGKNGLDGVLTPFSETPTRHFTIQLRSRIHIPGCIPETCVRHEALSVSPSHNTSGLGRSLMDRGEGTQE